MVWVLVSLVRAPSSYSQLPRRKLRFPNIRNGEMRAIHFGIDCVRDVQSERMDGRHVRFMTVYSDVDHVGRLIARRTRTQQQPLCRALDSIDQTVAQFGRENPDTALRSRYLDKRRQCHNSSYWAAHQAARLAVHESH